MIWYGLLASIAAVTCETYYRFNSDKMIWELPFALPLALMVNIGIWGMLRTQTILGMAVIFTLMTAFTRIIATFWLGDKPSMGTWVGFGLIIIASLVKTFWKTNVT